MKSEDGAARRAATGSGASASLLCGQEGIPDGAVEAVDKRPGIVVISGLTESTIVRIMVKES